MTSLQRVAALLDGHLPDRPPIYDTLRNDAVIRHFAGEELSPANVEQAVITAHARALDATKGFFKVPHLGPDDEIVDESQRRISRHRWTNWEHPVSYASSQEYARIKGAATAGPWQWTAANQRALETQRAAWLELQARSGDLARDWGYAGPPRLDHLFTEVGLEDFSYFLADCPEVIHRQIEHRWEMVLYAIDALPLPESALVVNEACDMAFKTGLIFSPAFLRRSFFPGFGRVCHALHARGVKVAFHSDGNLMPVMDDLVGAGIDLLHPVEPLAGMEPGEIHRRYPQLILLGTIDVSQLLPLGTPQQIRDQVVRNIEVTEGRIMVGSSTEVHNDVPLANYLAMHDAVTGYQY